MHKALPHTSDFLLAERCLDGDAAAIDYLKQRYGAPLARALATSGVPFDAADATVESLWPDCLCGSATRPPALRQYTGASSLQTWLRAVALNKWLMQRRKEDRERHRMRQIEREAEVESQARIRGGSQPFPSETPLLELLRAAIEHAFAHCSPEDFVLLQLFYSDELRQRELARMFNTTNVTVSRNLERARERIAKLVFEHIRATDPWLELRFEDFLELCSVAAPSCFGIAK